MTLLNPSGQEISSDITSLTERQLKKERAMNATIADVEEISFLQAKRAMNHLGNQIPPLIAQHIAEAFAAFAEVSAAREAELLARLERLERCGRWFVKLRRSFHG